jgi:hypothetical protein
MPNTNPIGGTMIIEFTANERARIDDIRDMLHRETLRALKAHNVDYMGVDLTEAAESIALSGRLYYES